MKIFLFLITSSLLPAVGMEELDYRVLLNLLLEGEGEAAGIILPSQGKHKYFRAHIILIPLKLIWNIPDFLLEMRW